MPIDVNPDPVAEAEAKHAGKTDAVKTTYMWLAGLGVIVTGIMAIVTPHLSSQNRWLAVQEVGQAAPYPLSLSSPQMTHDIVTGNLAVSFTRPSISPTGWYASAARLKVSQNAGGSSYYTNGQWVPVAIPLTEPVSVVVPQASLPGGDLVDQGLYYATLELTLTNDTDVKKFALHSKYSWKHIALP